MRGLNNIDKIGIIGDVHFPFEHAIALDKALNILYKEKPTIIVVDGDLLDFPTLSRYTVTPEMNRMKISDQLALGWQFFSDLRKQHPKARIIYIEGNHDFRFKAYTLRMAPQLYEYIDLKRDLRLDELKIEFIQTQEGATKWTDTYVSISPDLKIGHFDICRNPVIPAGMTIRGIMQSKIKTANVVQAHIHRGAIIWDTNENGEKRFGVECPCLCKDPFYRALPNWQVGLVIIEKINQEWRPNLIVF